MRTTLTIAQLFVLALIFGSLQRGSCAVTVYPLKPGDILPDIEVRDLLNSADKSFKVSDYRDKLLVIDFWATTCGSCIESMPKIRMLQKRFGSEVKIICADYESSATVSKFLKSKRGAQSGGIPIITDDIVLKEYFPHRFLPHVVWIYKGKFIAATEGDYFNEKNIAELLVKQQVSINEKKQILDFNYYEPITTTNVNPKLNSIATVHSFLITGYIPGLATKSGVVKDSLKSLKRFYYINEPVINLIATSLKTGLIFLPNRRILNVRDSSAYIYDSHKAYRDKWLEQHAFTVEAYYPLQNSDADYDQEVLLNLKNILKVTGKVEWRERNCYALVNESDKRFLSASTTPIKPNSDDLPENSRSNLVFDLNRLPGMIPVLDERTAKKETAYERPKDWAGWVGVLKTQGLALIPVRALIPVFILSEENYPY